MLFQIWFFGREGIIHNVYFRRGVILGRAQGLRGRCPLLSPAAPDLPTSLRSVPVSAGRSGERLRLRLNRAGPEREITPARDDTLRF